MSNDEVRLTTYLLGSMGGKVVLKRTHSLCAIEIIVTLST